MLVRVPTAKPQISLDDTLESDLAMSVTEITSCYGVDKRSLLPLDPRARRLARDLRGRTALEGAADLCRGFWAACSHRIWMPPRSRFKASEQSSYDGLRWILLGL